MDAGVRHQAGLELCEVHVEGPVKTQGASDGGHDLAMSRLNLVLLPGKSTLPVLQITTFLLCPRILGWGEHSDISSYKDTNPIGAPPSGPDLPQLLPYSKYSHTGG